MNIVKKYGKTKRRTKLKRRTKRNFRVNKKSIKKNMNKKSRKKLRRKRKTIKGGMWPPYGDSNWSAPAQPTQTTVVGVPFAPLRDRPDLFEPSTQRKRLVVGHTRTDLTGRGVENPQKTCVEKGCVWDPKISHEERDFSPEDKCFFTYRDSEGKAVPCR